MVMNHLQSLVRAIRQKRLTRVIHSPEWADRLLSRGVQPHQVGFDKKTNSILLREFELAVPPNLLFFADALHLARLLRSAGAHFTVVDGELHVSMANLDVIAESAEDFFILTEVFVRRCYQFAFSQPVVVWDIGMNVGFAALFFATQPKVIAVRSFEPFERTYRQAERNLRLNAAVASKIRTVCRGVGASNQSVEASYSYEIKGHASTQRNGFGEYPDQPVTKETIQLQAAADTLETIRAEFPDHPIVAKIDCEGAEYSIIESLAAANRLRNLAAVMIEWHHRGPEPLLELLNGCGFFAFANSVEKNGTAGMIYATQLPPLTLS
ncbi:MAG: FkbM family methyltransferase [Candidatus Korobacteraceae bacterium]